MSGIEDVAALAGVSIATVSRALNGRGQIAASTRQRVEEAAARLGYVASASASSLASGRTRNIGVLMPDMERWFRASVLAGIAETLGRHGFDLTLYNISEDGAQRSEVFDTSLRRRRVDGVIAISLELSEDESRQLADAGLPVISVGGSSPRGATLSVDDFAVAHLATDHLIGLGHRVIGHIGGVGDIGISCAVPSDRRRGFESAPTSAGTPVEPSLVVRSEYSIEAGSRSAKQLLGRPGVRPTAIFAGCDEIAIGAILAARDLGYRVPDDVSIIGIDGHELGEFFSLTTVDQFPRHQGERAADAVLDQVLGPVGSTPPVHSDVPYELVVRGTTRAPATREGS